MSREADIFRRLENGWQYEKGNWYYIRSGRAVRGWIRVSGKWYYLAANGAMQTGWVKDNGKWYYLASGGAMKTGWLGIGDRTFYLTNGGVRVTGWRTINGKRYCFRSNGVLDVAKTRKANAGDIICYYGHVAIYLGDGRIVHASNSRDGIKISERADYRTIASIRRIFE